MSLLIESVVKRAGAETHLFEMTLQLESGLNVLLGPTLAGKTSLMRLLAGLDQPSSGRIVLHGADMSRVPVQKRSVAFVYQQFVNYPSFTVFDNIASPLRVKGGLSATEIRNRVLQVAQLMHLEPLLSRLPAQLSGGQQQRTAIARALVKETDLLLLDEPLVNLDYKLREELRAEMREIFARRQAIVVYSTTEPLEALLMGGRIAVLRQGRLLQSGETLQVYHQPASQQVGEVFSDPPMNLFKARVEKGALHFASTVFGLPQHMKGLLDGAYQLGLRANHGKLESGASEDFSLVAKIEIAEISGSQTYVHTRLESSGERVVVQLEGVRDFGLGQLVQLFVKPQRLFVFDLAGQLLAAPATGTKVGQHG